MGNESISKEAEQAIEKLRELNNGEECEQERSIRFCARLEVKGVDRISAILTYRTKRISELEAMIFDLSQAGVEAAKNVRDLNTKVDRLIENFIGPERE